mmetsp:Transcript_36818/g.86623  ORF Transcript_36818/g.86623 Transcript_36818/m.86623 type:complete len:266 (-) Transcript_36818:145-942(-)
MTNKERLATETVQVECAIESSDRWGMKLKSVRPPITVTLVAPASLAHSAGIAQGDVIVGVDGQSHEGPSLAYVQKALREGGPRALTLCRSALSVIARFLAPSFSPHVREAAATALGCVSSFYPPAQLLLIQCGTLPLLLPCLPPPSPPPLLLATADALTNAALNPLNHPTLSSSSLISHAVPLLRHDNEDIRWKAAQLLSLLLSGSLSLSPPPPPAQLFLDAGGRDALQACLSLSPATTVSGAMGRPGAREYAVSMLAELSVHCH